MNNPELEIKAIVLALTENDDAKLHKATVDKYFTRDASFIHPLCTVPAGPNSREQLKNVYAVYKFFTRDIHLDIQKVTIDSNCTRAVIEMEESLSASFLPIWRVKRLKIITVLDFERRENKFYIKKQYGMRLANEKDCLIRADAFPIDHISEVVPFGFLYSWYKSTGGLVGNLTGALLQRFGLW